MLREVISNERQQFLILAGLSLGIVLLAAVAYALDRQLFNRLLGNINPVLASTIIVLVGGILLLVLVAREWFAIYRPWEPGRFLLPAGLAILLAVLMSLVDAKVVLPEELNAPFPQSILYYPAVGYAAEIMFHVLPLFLLLTASTWLPDSIRFEAIIWPCFVIVSLIEPIYQTRPMLGEYPAWAAAYVFLNVWVINLVGLALFNRYDFVTMYAFRLLYYLPWHIIWGHVRLSLLFD
jgi:hypothetical protein